MGEHFSGASLVGAAPFFYCPYITRSKGIYNGNEHYQQKIIKSSTDVIGVISALAGLATAATPLVANAINNAKK